MKSFIVISIALFAMACNGTKSETETSSDSTLIGTTVHPLPVLQQIDSIDANFFPNVNEQKIYTRISITDTGFIKRLINTDITNPALYTTACEYDTKFFCFAKGEIVKTLYLATKNDSCAFVGYVKSGGISVKTVLSEESRQSITQLKLKAKKP